ncbi:tRNA lysidine(34) synthetase TilS [Sphingomonas rhizophila]|uniref:tRNA(Ile)-lysidine synthase n=1 Tax=Sphingomonas rhizophila TaxID=2071607 RepID=A0A7G9S9L9_9SPHN|nr:tRNA lysidine(34) synthetase TilS [Sphingomonas rhizophila]QNN64544.1 tRNA lysidine(34) synthetase TilS [Sphingomonas rhizophila]
MTPGAEEVRRFADDLDALLAPDARLGLAVSGGPDSLALLLLAAAARPGLVEAATVDHGLRAESAAEAQSVADLCRSIGVPHSILTAHWDEKPATAIQALARDARYSLLIDWARDRGLAAIATAHHADDQAETLLMRLARAAGVGGLAGIRARREQSGIALFRPLLDWRRDELRAVVESAGVQPVDDPANRDPAHERTRARQFLAGGEWPNPRQLAASARHLADAEDALAFVAEALFEERASRAGDGWSIDASRLPVELQRRLLLRLFFEAGDVAPRGPDLDRAIASLRAGKRCTLGRLMLTGGERWRAEPVPPRRT